MSEWVRFSDLVPSRQDANPQGDVELLETNGSRRVGMWDWIPPSTVDAAARWEANGFVAWRRLPSESSHTMNRDGKS